MPAFPEATLRIECFMTNPPRPGGIGIFLDGKLAATLSLEEFKKTAERLRQLEDAGRARTSDFIPNPDRAS
jgi:hypothetical protein